MSGALTTLTGLAGSVPGASGLASLVAGLLSAGSWRGVPFYLSTSEEASGHRQVKFLYPGQAQADRQFLGPEDGPMRIDGLLIGDDCVAQAGKLRAVCQAAGPGKLRHPWFGQFDAVLTEELRLSVAEAEFGVVRFTMSVERAKPVTPVTPDFFGRLQDSIDSLMGQATDLLSDALMTASGPLALFSFASGLLTTAGVMWSGLGLGPGGSDVAQATAAAVVALQTAALPFDATFPAAAADLLAAPAIAIADASQPAEQSAIGAGPTAVLSPPAIDPADAAPVLLQAASTLASAAGAPPQVQAIALAAQMQAAGQAVAVGASIGFSSTADQAAAWRDQVDGALQSLQAVAEAVAVVLPLPAGAAWRAIDAVRQLAVADLNTRLVSLPAAQSVTTDRTMDAWKIALALYGDTPALMATAVVDLWARNLLVNPAIVPPGTYAVVAT